jgi:hypothetical protein
MLLCLALLYLVGKSQLFGKNPRTSKLFRKELLLDGLTAYCQSQVGKPYDSTVFHLLVYLIMVVTFYTRLDCADTALLYAELTA